MNNTAFTWSIAITIVLLVFALLSLFTRWILSTCPISSPATVTTSSPSVSVRAAYDASATASLSRGREHCSYPSVSVSAAYAWNRNHAANRAGSSCVGVGGELGWSGWLRCIIIFVSLLLCCLCRLGCVGYHNRSSHVVLRTTAEQNTDTMRTVRNIADKLRKIADKCEHAGINFLTWKGKIVYLLVTLDTTKKIQSCMIDTYVIPKYTYWNRVPSSLPLHEPVPSTNVLKVWNHHQPFYLITSIMSAIIQPSKQSVLQCVQSKILFQRTWKIY